MREDALAGLFVGGQASRMSGRPKGLLPTSDGTTIVERWRTILRRLEVPMVLVGAHPDYAHLPEAVIEDTPPGIGPLGGLLPLLSAAGPRKALALACDMPFVSQDLVERLLAATGAPIVAPRRGDHWEPLCATYDAAQVLPYANARRLAGRFSLQGLLDEVGAKDLGLTSAESEQLRDWDAPEDIDRGSPGRPPAPT